MGGLGLDSLAWGPSSCFWVSHPAGSQPYPVSCFSLEGEKDQVLKKIVQEVLRVGGNAFWLTFSEGWDVNQLPPGMLMYGSPQ